MKLFRLLLYRQLLDYGYWSEQDVFAFASGGSGVYSSYQWYVDGSSRVSGATSSTFSFVPGSPGSYLTYVTVTDSLGTLQLNLLLCLLL